MAFLETDNPYDSNLSEDPLSAGTPSQGGLGLADISSMGAPAAAPIRTGVPGLDLLNQWSAQIRSDRVAEQKSNITKEAVRLWQAGDKKGALGLIGVLEPASFAKSAIAQTEAPEIARSKAQATLDVETAAGVNKDQLLTKTLKGKEAEAEAKGLARGLEKGSEEKSKQANRNDQWATRIWSELKSAQDFKNFQDYRLKEGTLLNAAKNPSAYGDIGTIFSFMKLLDPSSVVRESEYATAANAGSLLTRVKNIVNKAEKGEILTQDQRNDLAQMTKHLGSIYKQNYDSLLKPIRVQAKDRGVPMSKIDPFEPDPAEALPPGVQGAQDWLEKNPNDPKAPAVREKLKAMGY